MPAKPPPALGLIGIGLLGTEMARRLIKAGRVVIGYDLQPERRREFSEMGGEPAVSSGDVFTRCTRVLLSLPTHEHVSTLLASDAAALRRGHTLIDTTTGDPASSEALAADLGARGIIYLDATVSGSSTQMRNGAAVMMVGGDQAAFEACRDVFEMLAGAAFHTGPAGTGAKMKLATNLVLGLNRAVLAEGLAFAEALALDPELTLAILRRSPAYSRAMDTKGDKMIRRDFAPEARLSQHLKDVRLILDAGTASGLPMPFSRTHREWLEAAETAGFGGMDNSAIFQVLTARTTNKSPA